MDDIINKCVTFFAGAFCILDTNKSGDQSGFPHLPKEDNNGVAFGYRAALITI
jgi:hypothetical protein